MTSRRRTSKPWCSATVRRRRDTFNNTEHNPPKPRLCLDFVFFLIFSIHFVFFVFFFSAIAVSISRNSIGSSIPIRLAAAATHRVPFAEGNFCLMRWEETGQCSVPRATAQRTSIPSLTANFSLAVGTRRQGASRRDRVRLDHGEVLQWCPKNNPVRALLGSLKSNVDPIPLPVYPVKVEADGTILTSFLK